MIGINASPATNKICFGLARPINNNIKQLDPNNNAVDKLAGAINRQIIATGNIIGRKPFLKSLITSCFLLNNLARYMNNASFARSDVCMVRLIKGNLIQRLPSFILTPKNNVYINKGIASRNNMLAILE